MAEKEASSRRTAILERIRDTRSQPPSDYGRARAPVIPERYGRWLSMPWLNGLAGLAVLIVASAAMGWNNYHSFLIESIAIFGIAAYGLNIATGYAGVFSLGAGAAFALGGYTVAILDTKHGFSSALSVLCAIVLSGLLGLLMGLPASRLGGIGLAMVSVGFLLVMGDIALNAMSLTGGNEGIAGVVPHVGWGSNSKALTSAQLDVIILCALYITFLIHAVYRSSALGRKSFAVKGEPLGARALGISVPWIQVVAVAFASALGGLAGSLYVYSDQFVSPDITNLNLSFLFVIMIVLGGVGNRYGPLVGAAVIVLIPVYLSPYPGLDTYIYAGLLLAVVLVHPRGLLGRTAVRVSLPDVRRSPPVGSSEAPPREIGRRDLLECVGISISFSGLLALDDVTVRAGAGEVVAIVGPNGSGKTTLLNVASGFYIPTAGTVRLDGNDLTGRRAAGMARAGIGRTFQTPKVFPDISAAEHIALGLDSRLGSLRDAPDDPLVAIGYELMDAARIDIHGSVAEVRVLSHGQRRFLEVAMAIVRHPSILLLDEPATGLSAQESALLVRAIDQVAREGVGVMVVEHQLDVVRKIADVVNVMHLGQILWSGPPDQLSESEEVRAAYLGRMA
jgi:branched-chain amino acid transport system permease protein